MSLHPQRGIYQRFVVFYVDDLASSLEFPRTLAERMDVEICTCVVAKTNLDNSV